MSNSFTPAPIPALTLEKATEFFTNLRYESSRGGQRGLQPHHIEQFAKALAEFLEAQPRIRYKVALLKEAK